MSEARVSGRSTGLQVALALVVVTIVVRLPGFLSTRHLVFDDGTYGVSVLDMRHGLLPYRGVFSAQGPLHFPLLYLGDLLGLRTIDGPRVTPMLSGIAATVGAWAIARRVAGPTAGVFAGVLVATSGSMIFTTSQVTGDSPASALAVLAVWAAVTYRDDPRLRRALLTGALMGAALAVKPLILPAALPVGWWLWSRRRVDHLGAAVGASIAVWFASALPWGLGRVWQQSVVYNGGAGPRYGKVSQLRKLASTLGSRDLLVVAALLFALGTLVAFAWKRRGPDGTGRIRPEGLATADLAAIAVWTVVTTFVLVLEPALYRNHLAAIVPPLSILAAILVRTPRVLLVVLLVLTPWAAFNIRGILRPTGYTGRAAVIMKALWALPGDAQVISDEEGFVYRAGLRTPPLLNDPSVKRIDQGLLTTKMVADGANDRRTCAVVVSSPRFGRDLPGLPAALERAGLQKYPLGGIDALWLRPSAACRLDRPDAYPATP